ncbi:proton-conducting transporter membrane subunit [Dermatophilaceae bacterium Sec6.4]
MLEMVGAPATGQGGFVDALLIGAPVAAPALAAVVALARRTPSRATGWMSVAAAFVILGSGVFAAVLTVDGYALRAGSLLRVDALSAVMLIVIGSVSVIATWANVDFVGNELASGKASSADLRRYTTLVPTFLAAMVLAVLANNLGLLWAAVEATTIVTAFLVGHRRSRGSVEATWKYVIICSVGIALAYLGTILVYYAAQQTTIPAGAALEWDQLVAHSTELDPGVMRIAFALLLIGYGAKAGMIPLHSWLPDAHSQAPAPVSALMSGVLLPVAVYALIRYRVIAVHSLDPSFVRALLLVVALASLVLATSLIIAQGNYKRLLAYSSIEHMSLIVIGLAIGTPLAIAASLLHIMGHGLGKAVLFCSAGQVLLLEGTSKIAGVRGILARRPVLAAVFGVGFLALLGLPPFSLFVSELGLARAASADGLTWVIALALMMVVIVFVAITTQLAPMILGSGSGSSAAGRDTGSTTPLVVGLVALATLGIVAWPVDQLLHAASLIAGTP